MKHFILPLVLLFAAAAPAQIRADNGSDGLSASNGGGNISGDCLSGAAVDYDGYALSTGALADWANDGSLGSGWDLSQAAAGNRPTVTASCSGASGNCVQMVDATDYITQAAASSATWTRRFGCAFIIDDAIGTNYMLSWTDVASDNYIGTDSGLGYYFRGDSLSTIATGGTASAGWHSICWDWTDDVNVDMWVDGVAVLTDADGSPASDPTHITVGALDSAGQVDATGVKFGRIMFWQVPPSCTAAGIDAALRKQRGL